tara:strand:+ start:624 stop:1505 length:882 start_codon:yes stop_codon:yes gene_type:complete
MEITKEIIKDGCNKADIRAIAFSGGSDSMVLLDILYKSGVNPVVVFADSQMEYRGTVAFVKEACKKYGLKANIAKADITPLEQWQRHGWAMLGKLSARLWNQKNKDKGFKLDVTACCRKMKIAPARKLARALNAGVQFTGQKGNQDDRLRGMRHFKDGALRYVKEDKIFICNPLIGWTDTMIRRYTIQNKLMVHPKKREGAKTIGCMYCGGGGQFDNSGFKILRHTDNKAWHKFMVEWEAGYIVLAIKYKVSLSEIKEVVGNMGGLDKIAKETPWMFDYLRVNPLKGYDKVSR